MIKDYPAVDADGHIWEPLGVIEDRVRPELRDQVPSFPSYFYTPGMRPELDQIFERDGIDGLLELAPLRAQTQRIGNTFKLWTGTTFDPRADRLPDGVLDAAAQVDYLKRIGFERAFLFPSFYLGRCTAPGEGSAELARCYNDWLTDYASYAPDMLAPVAILNVHDTDAALAEIRRQHERGTLAVLVASPPADTSWADAAYEPIWTLLEQLDLPVAFHPGGVPRKDSPRRSFGPVEMQAHITELISGGVLERHPNLRFAFLESGCGWLPFFLWKLDEELWNWRQPGHDRSWGELNFNTLRTVGYAADVSVDDLERNVTMAPSDYFRRQCWIATEDEPYIHHVADYLGADRIIFASDYPHSDHPPAFVPGFVDLDATIGPGLMGKILWDNPNAFYGAKV